MKLRLFFSVLLFSLLSFSGISQVTASDIPIVDDELVVSSVFAFVGTDLLPADETAYVVSIADVVVDPYTPIIDMSPRDEIVVRESEPPHSIGHVRTTDPPSMYQEYYTLLGAIQDSNLATNKNKYQLNIDHPDIE